MYFAQPEYKFATDCGEQMKYHQHQLTLMLH